MACAPLAPLTVRGNVPHAQGSYELIDAASVPAAARQALVRNLLARGLSPLAFGRPGLLVGMTLVDRRLPAGPLAAGRREVRLTIRFTHPAGLRSSELTAREVVGRSAPPPDLVVLIDAAFRQTTPSVP